MKNMKKVICILLAAMLLVSCTACGSSDDSKAGSDESSDRLAEIKERGYIEVCTEPYFAPNEFIDPSLEGDAQYVGVDIELAKYIAEKIGVELKIVALEYSAVLAGITDGKYDLAISSVAYSPAREEAMALSKGYLFGETGYGFLVREEDADKYSSVEDVKDAVIVTQSGSVQESLYYDEIGECKEFKLVSSMTDGFLAVSEGKADVCICNVDSAQLYADANGGLVVTSYRFEVDPDMNSVRVGAPKEGSDSLIELVNECIDELTEAGKFEAWTEEFTEYAVSLGIE